MRELVARYLSERISRRGFVGGLTKAGLTASAAQSVLSAVASVSPGHAQGAGPQPDAAPATPAPAPAATAPATTALAGVQPCPGPGRRRFHRTLDRLGSKILLRHFRERGCAVFRGARRPAAAKIHPHAA